MNTLLSGRVIIALVWVHCQDLLMHSSLTLGEEEFNMEDKLFVITVHQLQGYSKGTPNINYTSARVTQTLAGQCFRIFSHFVQHEGPLHSRLRPGTLKPLQANPVRDTQFLADQCNFYHGQRHTVSCRPVQLLAPSTTVRDMQSLADHYTHSPSTTARDTQPLAQTSSATMECFSQ